MKAFYDLTSDDLVAFWQSHEARSPESRRQRKSLAWVMLAVVGLPAWILVSTPKPFLETARAIWILLVPVVLTPVLIPLLWWRRRRLLKRVLSEGCYGPCSMELNDEGIRECKPSGESMAYWSAVKDVFVSDSYLYVYTSGIDGFVVPRRAFQSESEFNAFLKQVLAKTNVEPKQE